MTKVEMLVSRIVFQGQLEIVQSAMVSPMRDRMERNGEWDLDWLTCAEEIDYALDQWADDLVAEAEIRTAIIMTTPRRPLFGDRLDILVNEALLSVDWPN